MARYTEDQRAAAVADVLAGMSERQAERTHHIARRTIREWMLAQGAVSPEKRQALDERQELILHRYYDIIEAAADVYTDPDWLRRHDAQGAAVFLGVVSDKASLLTLLRERTARNRAAIEARALPAPVHNLLGDSSASS